jgi:hypothetical protein
VIFTGTIKMELELLQLFPVLMCFHNGHCVVASQLTISLAHTFDNYGLCHRFANLQIYFIKSARRFLTDNFILNTEDTINSTFTESNIGDQLRRKHTLNWRERGLKSTETFFLKKGALAIQRGVAISFVNGEAFVCSVPFTIHFCSTRPAFSRHG